MSNRQHGTLVFFDKYPVKKGYGDAPEEFKDERESLNSEADQALGTNQAWLIETQSGQYVRAELPDISEPASLSVGKTVSFVMAKSHAGYLALEVKLES